MKLSIVGAGSSYTPELIEEMIDRRDTLPVKELVLYDIDEKRLDIMTGFCRRFADKRGMQGLIIRATTDLDDALEGADFVDTQIRVGGNRQRVKDEKIPLKYGLVGQETTGAGGMMKAFRTIPVMMNVARHMEKVSPDGWIINYTNPAALVKTVQRLLNALEYKGKDGKALALDGDFGTNTACAVKAYQTAQKLAADGIVGALTWKALLGGN